MAAEDRRKVSPEIFAPFDGSEGVVLVTAIRRGMRIDDDEIMIANLTPLFTDHSLPTRDNTKSVLIDFNSDRIKARLEQDKGKQTAVDIGFITDHIEMLYRGEIDALEFRNVPGMTYGTFIKEIPDKGGYIQWHRRHLDKLIQCLEKAFAEQPPPLHP